MTRRLLNLLTTLSPLLCAAAVVLWAWTYGNWRVGARPGQILVYVAGGSDGQAETFVRQSLRENREAAGGWEFMRKHASTSVAVAGFEWHRGVTPRTGMTFPFTLLAVPVWPLLPLTLALPAVRLWLARRDRRRVRGGRCTRFGYDLRGTPGRCPECGTVAPASPAS